MKRYKKQRPSRQEWQDLATNQSLSRDYVRLSTMIQKAQAEAVQSAARMGGSPQEYYNPVEAIQHLQARPELLRYLQSVALQDSGLPPTITRSSPLGSEQNYKVPTSGVWSNGKENLDAVSNARLLRNWADSNEWVRAAINIRRQQIGRADVAVVPFNERRTYNRGLTKRIQLLLDQPNEYRQNYCELMSSITDDLLVLDRGVLLKDMTVDRKPVHLYAQDGATIKIFNDWNGSESQPRYMYESIVNNHRVPLRNDECIVFMANPATYRNGLSPVEVLRNTIQADLAATKSAMHMVDQKPPPHLIQLPGATQSQLEQIRAKYEMEIAGRREIFWLGGQTQANVTPLIFSAKDNQWLEWQVYLARKIAIVFQVSPQQLGITYDINKATAQSQQEIFEDTGLIPLLLLYEEYFNREILADFAPLYPDGRANLEALNLRILYPEITEADRQMHAERAINLATAGLGGLPSMTLNQVLALFGQEPVEGGNTFYVNNTTLGPIPWLSYDGRTGDFGVSSTAGLRGSQDPAGGVDEDEDQKIDPKDEASKAPPKPANPNQPSTSTGNSDNQSNPKPDSKPKPKNDPRPPGKHWRPHHQQERTMYVQQ